MMKGYKLVQRVGHIGAPGWLAAGERVACEVMGVRQVVDAGQAGAEQPPVVGDPPHRNAAEADAVIAARPADQPGPHPIAAHAVIGERDLQRGIRRLRPGIDEKDVVDIAGHQFGQPGRIAERQGMAHLEARGIVKRPHLAGDRVADPWIVVPGVHTPEAGGTVEDVPAVMGPVDHTIGRDQQPGRALELPVRRERHPIGAEIVRRRRIGRDRGVHGPTTFQPDCKGEGALRHPVPPRENRPASRSIRGRPNWRSSPPKEAKGLIDGIGYNSDGRSPDKRALDNELCGTGI